MPIKIARSTWCCRNIDDALDVLKKEKYLEWDLNILPFSLDMQRMMYVRDFVKDNGELRFHLPHSYWDVGINDRGVVDNSLGYYCRLFDTIQFLNAQYAVLHLGAATGSDEDTALQNLALLAKRANDCGITLCIENLIHGLTLDMNFMKKCLSVPHVSLCLDTGHAEVLRRQCGDSVLEDFASLKQKIIHAHVYDYEEKMNHIPFTEKSIKTNVWLSLLQTTDCAWYTMELELQIDQDRQKTVVEEYLRNR